MREGLFRGVGTFFQQDGNDAGTARRLFFGDFDVQHDEADGSTTATLSGKIAWERMVSEHTMLGYFIGGELAWSDISGTFDGDQNSFGITAGAYFVSALGAQLFADGFGSVGIGHNQLEMSSPTLALESEYVTRSASFGAALTGVIPRDGYEIWPEIALTAGRPLIGDVDFTGRAYGLVDNTLSLDAGDVSIFNLTLRPEIRIPVDGEIARDSTALLTFAPRLLCESVDTGAATTQGCGGGAEFGYAARSDNGLSFLNARVLYDRIGSNDRSALQLELEHRF